MQQSSNKKHCCHDRQPTTSQPFNAGILTRFLTARGSNRIAIIRKDMLSNTIRERTIVQIGPAILEAIV